MVMHIILLLFSIVYIIGTQKYCLYKLLNFNQLILIAMSIYLLF